jgi:hypothetical protein
MFESLKKSLGLNRDNNSFQTGRGNVLGHAQDTTSSRSSSNLERNLPKATSNDGVNNHPQEASAEDYSLFELIFIGEQLGMSLTEHKVALPIDTSTATANRISRAVVTEVKLGSEADRNGVHIGDVVLALNDNKLTNFDHFYSMIIALARPLTIR